MLRAFVQYTLNVDLNAPVIKDLVEKYKDWYQNGNHFIVGIVLKETN